MTESLAEATAVTTPPFDVEAIRAEFPILRETVGDKPLVYLDSAASSQKPRVVLDAERECLEHYYANVHRGVHHLSVRSTEAFEEGRESARRFLNAPSRQEIIFVRGTTEAINLVAQTYGRQTLQPGDEVLITEMEHHSNIVPWQMLCEATGATLRVTPIDDAGVLRIDEFERLLSGRTKIVAFTHVSNALGTINPVKELTAMAHEHGAIVLVDGAQAAPHLAIDLRELDCDFFVLTAHKLFGPSGIGVLYGKLAHLDSMPPYQGGGDMIESVTLEKTTYAPVPHKFEAGTPDISGVIGLGAAIDYVERLGLDAIAAHDLMIKAALAQHDADIKTRLDQVDAKLMEIRDLLLTPQGLRPGWPLRPGKTNNSDKERKKAAKKNNKAE